MRLFIALSALTAVFLLAGVAQADPGSFNACGPENPQCMRSDNPDADRADSYDRMSAARSTREATFGAEDAEMRFNGGDLKPSNWALPTRNPARMTDGIINAGPVGGGFDDPVGENDDAAAEVDAQAWMHPEKSQQKSTQPKLPTRNPARLSDGVINFGPEGGGHDPVGEDDGTIDAEQDGASNGSAPGNFTPPLPRRNPAELGGGSSNAGLVGGGFDDPVDVDGGSSPEMTDSAGMAGRPAHAFTPPLPNRNPGDVGMGRQSSSVGGGFGDPTDDGSMGPDTSEQGAPDRGNQRGAGNRPVGFCPTGANHCRF